MANNFFIKNLKKEKYYNQKVFLFKQNFIGKLIKKGNKFYAINCFNAFKHLIKKKAKIDFNLLIFLALFYSNIKLHFIKKRFGGSKKDIPIYLNKIRQVKFIIKKMFNYSKSSEKRKSLDLSKLVNLCLLTIKKKGFLISEKNKAFIKAKENKILIRSLKQ